MSEIPPEVRKFLYEHIATLEELELLVLMSRQPDRAWTDEAAEAELKIPTSSIISGFQALRKSGLVEVVPDLEEKAHRLPLRDPLVRASVAKLAAAYQTQRFEILKLVSEAAMDRVRNSMTRAFADAFVLGGKKRKDG